MSMTPEEKKAFEQWRNSATGKGAWLLVRGHEFSDEEARQAADFSDVVDSYGLEPEELKTFVHERDLKLGVKLYLAEKMPVHDLGVLLLGEEDPRLIAIAQERCSQDRNGTIIIDL
jgi:hypothetical protein